MAFDDASQLRIAVIGGWTGSYNLLRGLQTHGVELTAIVSTLDDGGSSGRLRDEFGHLPPGDVRRCLLALSRDDHSGASCDACWTIGSSAAQG